MSDVALHASKAAARSAVPPASNPAPGAWFFLRHEMRLAFRDFIATLTAGRPQRRRLVAVLGIAFVVLVHLIAAVIVGPHARVEASADRAVLLVVTGCILLSASLMLSQAMDSVTRSFYSRADLDLILSSPATAQRAFLVRAGILAASSILMAMLFAAPFINVLIWRGGARWLSAYVSVLAIGAFAVAIAIGLSMLLFRVIGPARARLVAQLVAAVIGAAFVIGLQVGAVVSFGSMSQLAFLQSPALVALVPNIESLAWWPARALLGDRIALATIAAIGTLSLAVAVTALAARFADHAQAAASVAGAQRRRVRRAAVARRSPPSALRHKEWMLLRRDPWLASQTLTQLLYLLPAALMLWSAFGRGNGDLVLLVPVLVMASGQLAGGLAWLAISGEDAPELVQTAPVKPAAVIRAKIEAVGLTVGVIFAPFVLIMAIASRTDGLWTAVGVAGAATAAVLIQIWFRQQGERRRFNRRHTASRVATFAEAFSSIAWAATAGLAAAGHWHAGITAALALIVLGTARLARPPRN